MANIMIRKSDKGYVFYMPKRDIEDSIVSMEFDTPEKWGGEIKLGNGGIYYIEPQAAPAAQAGPKPSWWQRLSQGLLLLATRVRTSMLWWRWMVLKVRVGSSAVMGRISP